MPLVTLRKKRLTFVEEFLESAAYAEKLLACLEAKATRSAITEVHRLGGTSQQIQDILRVDLEQLGFESEKKGLFSTMSVSALRPDFYRKVGRSGIIAEVERGKTITNNMDLLDLWKCHICPVAHFLFIIVPQARPSENGTVIRAYEQAGRRLATFFEEPNYVNVAAVFLFGY